MKKLNRICLICGGREHNHSPLLWKQHKEIYENSQVSYKFKRKRK